MSCVAGIRTMDGGIVMGADSAACSGWQISVQVPRKVFIRGQYVIGFTTSFRMGQLLEFGDFLPGLPINHADAGFDLHAFMCDVFIDDVRRRLSAGGFTKKEHEREEGGAFIVGVRGRIFRVQDDFSVVESVRGYDAVGCGMDAALGALFATEQAALGPLERLRMALAAAEAHSNGVRGPFVFSSLDTILGG